MNYIPHIGEIRSPPSACAMHARGRQALAHGRSVAPDSGLRGPVDGSGATLALEEEGEKLLYGRANFVARLNIGRRSSRAIKLLVKVVSANGVHRPL